MSALDLVEQHAEWLAGRAEKPNLSRADLSRADLSRAVLSRADLSRADLCGAVLSDANLCGAVLSDANLSWANLSRANLSRANLCGAVLSDANLCGANLSWANLSRANLSWADLSNAVGFHALTHTAHGYRVDASWRGNKWRIIAGCRDFSIADARAHWGAADYHTPSSGAKVLAMLDWLEQQPTPKVG